VIHVFRPTAFVFRHLGEHLARSILRAQSDLRAVVLDVSPVLGAPGENTQSLGAIQPTIRAWRLALRQGYVVDEGYTVEDWRPITEKMLRS
jgi:hypothetical protein